MMDLGEPPRSQLVIRVVPGTVVPGARGNGGCVPLWLVCSRLPSLITRCLT
jgi:hypothetical protein